MQIHGLMIGAFSFLVIGLFHPIVIKCEYYFSSRIWPVFLVAGLICLGASLVAGEALLSALAAVTGFTCLWSIGELKQQARRVERGWFPANPNRPGGKTGTSARP